MEIGQKIDKLPLEVVQSIRYEWVENPKNNYDNFIAYLKEHFHNSCGNGCRFNKMIISRGQIIKIPSLVRTCKKTCHCGESVYDYDFTYCHKHAPFDSDDFSRYHSRCSETNTLFFSNTFLFF